jgi:voltage-gated potassium channel
MKKLQAATDTLKELAAVYALLVLGSAAFFMALEDVSFLDSVYWAGTTATSTGYGDISPKTSGGRVLALLVMHLSIFGIAPLIVVRLIDRLNEDRNTFTHEEQVRILEGIARIEEALKSEHLKHSQEQHLLHDQFSNDAGPDKHTGTG